MNPDDIAAELRSRDGGEAIDLGMAVGRRFWTSIIVPWLILVGGLFAVGAGLMYLWGTAVMAAWTFLCLWLLKPAFDRIPLFVVSRGLFGDVPSTGRTLRHVLSQWLSMGMVFDCTVRRLSPYRSFTMPIRDLEHHSDDQYSDRRGALLRKGMRRSIISLTGVGAITECLMVIATIAFVRMVLPTELGTGKAVDLTTWADGSGFPVAIALVVLAAYLVAVTLVEIFYVSSGFGLYINRRVALEGWDIELDFRRMAKRYQNRRGSQMAGLWAAAGLAAGLVFAGAAPEAWAESPDPEIPAPIPADGEAVGSDTPGDDPQKTIDEILEAPEFGHKEEQWRWVPKTSSSPEEETERSRTNSGGFDWGLTKGLGAIVEILLWLAAGGTVIVFAYLVITRVSTEDDGGAAGGADEEIDPAPEVVDVDADESTPFELPPDLVERATEQWDAGNHAAGLSLLYRGTIRGLADRHGIDIAPHMTARECTRTVEAAGGPGEYMARLARAWTSTAYADRPPTDAEARELFADWRRHFERGRR